MKKILTIALSLLVCSAVYADGEATTGDSTGAAQIKPVEKSGGSVATSCPCVNNGKRAPKPLVDENGKPIPQADSASGVTQ